MWDGLNVFAFFAFVICIVFVSNECTNNSRVRGIYYIYAQIKVVICFAVKEIGTFCFDEKYKLTYMHIKIYYHNKLEMIKFAIMQQILFYKKDIDHDRHSLCDLANLLVGLHNFLDAALKW